MPLVSGKVDASVSRPSRTVFWLACIPIRNLELARSARLIDLDRVLERMDGLEVLRVVRIDQRANRDDDVARPIVSLVNVWLPAP